MSLDIAFAAYPVDHRPIYLEPDVFVQFAMTQLQRRFDRIERARRQSIHDVHALEAME